MQKNTCLDTIHDHGDRTSPKPHSIPDNPLFFAWLGRSFGLVRFGKFTAENTLLRVGTVTPPCLSRFQTRLSSFGGSCTSIGFPPWWPTSTILTQHTGLLGPSPTLLFTR